MTIIAEMKDRALAEFDEMVAEREREIRSTMKAAGASQFEIDAYVESCRQSLARQRAGVGRLVTVELMKAGVPLVEGSNDNVLS
jgi:hypothetical protein